MAGLFIEVQPTAEPLVLADVKNHLRVDTNDDDALITALIVSARELAEAFTARSFCFKVYRQVLDAFPYYTDTVDPQPGYPTSYYALQNYSQMIKLLVSPLATIGRITFLSSTDSQYHDMLPQPLPWYPGIPYVLGDQVTDNLGKLQKCTTAGTSSSDPPVWNAVIGGFTIETTGLVWQNQGPATFGQFGRFLVDSISEPPRIFPAPPSNTWPSVLYVPNAVQIHFTAGYSADGTLVPSRAKTAMLQLIAGWYEHREAISPLTLSEMPNHVKALLWSLRVIDYAPTQG